VHIPDGYLSPETCAVMYGATAPFWVVAARRVRRVVKTRYVPLLALGAAYCFLVMMFNVPVPDGTTAHAVGAVLVAVLLGPWAAVIAVSVALAIQALFFGDGGVLAFGANCFNMAVVMPFVGYALYRAIAGRVFLTSPRRALAAGVGAYVGINAAALCAAIEFGLQPDLFYKTTATGGHVPLYAPFHLSQTIPAMLGAHLLVAGVVEFVLTVGVIAYLQRANLPILRINHPGLPDAAGQCVADDRRAVERRPRLRGIFIGLAGLVALVPLGLLASGGAFGEDSPSALDLRKYGLDAVPTGLQRYSDFWSSALFPGYDFEHGSHPNLGYYASAVIGTVLIAGVVVAGFRVAAVSRHRRDRRGRRDRPGRRDRDRADAGVERDPVGR
jgi:cobalt/nickel transport system permease protein